MPNPQPNKDRKSSIYELIVFHNSLRGLLFGWWNSFPRKLSYRWPQAPRGPSLAVTTPVGPQGLMVAEARAEAQATVITQCRDHGRPHVHLHHGRRAPARTNTAKCAPRSVPGQPSTSEPKEHAEQCPRVEGMAWA